MFLKKYNFVDENYNELIWPLISDAPILRIAEIAAKACKNIIYSSESVVQFLQQNIKKFKTADNRQVWTVHAEIIFLFSYLAHKVAVVKFKTFRDREIYELSVIKNFLIYYSEHAPTNARSNRCKTEFLKLHDARQIEYSKCKIREPQEGSPKGTLLWEFGKKIAHILTDDTDFNIIFTSINVIVGSMDKLDLETVFSSEKK